MMTAPTSFRLRVLAGLRTARDRWPSAHLYLLYAPGFDDPLHLAGDDEPPRRDTALVPWASRAGYDKPQYPRVIALDCRRVAAYLLETDPAFDDPLLEDSITHAHRELQAGAQEPDGDEGTGRTVCGWIASPDSTDIIASRIARAGERLDPADGRRHWLRWHDPRMLALQWPQMTDAQKTALLGPQLSWLAVDAAGHLVEFSSPPDAARFTPTHTDPLQRSLRTPQVLLTAPQWQTTHHTGLVNHLVQAWGDQRDQPLPRDAAEAVHRKVLCATGWGLEGRDIHAYVLTAIELHDGFERDPLLQDAVGQAALAPGTLADRLHALPAEFWERHRRAA